MLGSWTKRAAVVGLVLATGATAIGAGNVASAAERYWNQYTQSWEWRPDSDERAYMRERAREEAYLRERAARREWREEQRERAAEQWRRQKYREWREEQRGWKYD